MSSYLLAFVVSDLQFVDNEDTRQPGATLHRVWVRPDSLDKAWYAVEASDLVLQALENYTRFDYELPKVDSAGVPNKGGAMENWLDFFVDALFCIRLTCFFFVQGNGYVQRECHDL